MDIEDVDPEIRGVIQELNELGYGTHASCAGHGKVGYILFDRRYSHEPIRGILEGLGIDIIEIEDDVTPWHPALMPSEIEVIGYLKGQGINEAEAKDVVKSMGPHLVKRED